MHHSADLFSDAFRDVAINVDDKGRLQGLEVLVVHDDKKYALEIQTAALHLSRIDPDAPESDTDGDQTYIIAADEILPVDILDIKGKSFEELESFLVEQE